MAAERVQFVTGYPGFIGKRLVRRLAEQARGTETRLVLLVQPKGAQVARAALAAEGIAAEIVEGDVEQMHLGLSGAEFKALAREVTDVWHLAARSYLHASRDELRRVNVEGTRNVLDLAAAGHALAFYDTPLLFEIGLDRTVDCVVVVWAPPDVQRARLAARDGLLAGDADARLAAQLPIDDKAARADFVVENVGPVAELGPKADRLLADLRRGLGRKLPNAPPLRS